MLDALVLGIVKHALGSGDPATPAGPLQAVHERDPQPEGTACRSRPVGGPERLVMGLRPRLLALGIATVQVRGDGEVLEVGRLERRLPRGGRQLGIGSSPRLFVEGLPASIQRGGRSHGLPVPAPLPAVRPHRRRPRCTGTLQRPRRHSWGVPRPVDATRARGQPDRRQ
jgi:hypothetical protein